MRLSDEFRFNQILLNYESENFSIIIMFFFQNSSYTQEDIQMKIIYPEINSNNRNKKFFHFLINNHSTIIFQIYFNFKQSFLKRIYIYIYIYIK